jgi:F-type H+-transporting ATPase subunit b
MEGGLPQLDPTWFAAQLFWLAVSFVALYLVLSRGILPAVQQTIETRESTIRADLDNAAVLKTQAATAQEHYEAALAKSRQESARMLAEVTQSVKEKAAEKSRILDASLKAQAEQSEKDIAKATEAAMKNLVPATVEVTSLILETLMAKKADAAIVEATVERLRKEMA